VQPGIKEEGHMRATIVVPTLTDETIRRHVIAQARALRENGDDVHLAMPTAPVSLFVELGTLGITVGESVPASDLYIYHHAGQLHPLLAGLRQQDQGSVIVHDHGSAPKDWLPAHYADLCLVDEGVRRDELMDVCGLAPERVQILPPPDDQSEYGAAVNQWVHQVCADDWPKVSSVEELPAALQARTEPVAGLATSRGALKLAEKQADIMLRDYQVRSRIPVVGGLVAWLRCNLTSHLREPYLDPTLERQVAFNRSVLEWMEQVQTRLEALESRAQDLPGQSSPPAQDAVEGATGDQALGTG
jgi:hypothetical protein